MSAGMILYDLTPLTGRKAAADRTVVIMSYDINYLLARVLLLSLLPAILLGAMFYPLLHSYTLIVVLLAEIALTFVFYARSSTGLQLRVWRKVWNRSRSNLGKVLLRNREVAVDRPAVVMVTQASRPNPFAHDISDADVFGAVPERMAQPAAVWAPAPERRTGPPPDDWY